MRVSKLLLLLILSLSTWGCTPSEEPAGLPPGATFEIFALGTDDDPDTILAEDPSTGEPLYLRQPPIVATADVATVARSVEPVPMADGSPSQSTSTVLHVELTPAVAEQLTAASKAAQGEPIAVMINGQVISTPTLRTPLQGSFQLSSGDKRFEEAVRAITAP